MKRGSIEIFSHYDTFHNSLKFIWNTLSFRSAPETGMSKEEGMNTAQFFATPDVNGAVWASSDAAVCDKREFSIAKPEFRNRLGKSLADCTRVKQCFGKVQKPGLLAPEPKRLGPEAPSGLQKRQKITKVDKKKSLTLPPACAMVGRLKNTKSCGRMARRHTR